MGWASRRRSIGSLPLRTGSGKLPPFYFLLFTSLSKPLLLQTMPFDPSLPATDSSLSSAVMRSQLTGLKSLIDALQTITQAQVDGVTVVPPIDPASVTVSVVGDTLHFSFAIPQGFPGANGPEGPVGPPGEVTLSALASAIAGTSANSDGVGLLNQIANPGYDPFQIQILIDKVNELISALRRSGP